MSASRLALGTAQFGLHYGIANTAGQVSQKEASEILSVAQMAGIDTIDTAIAYGTSASCLGKVGVSDLKVITKLPPIPADCLSIGRWIKEQVESSCEQLRTDRLYGLLLHRARDLSGQFRQEIVEAFSMLKQSRAVTKVGISIYSPSELPDAMSVPFVDLVQAPLNLVDRRLVVSGWLDRLHDSGVEVHSRSVFLQGLLLMPRRRVLEAFSRWSNVWQRWFAFLDETGVAPHIACLSYALSFPKISRVVVGVDNVGQLEDLVAVAEQPSSFRGWPEIASQDEFLINPSNWGTR